MIRNVVIETDASGDFTYERRMAGVIRAVAFTLGDLSTPDVTISDGVYSLTFFAKTGLAADANYQLAAPVQGDDGVDITDAYAPPAILGSLKVVVAGGGVNKTGSLRFLID